MCASEAGWWRAGVTRVSRERSHDEGKPNGNKMAATGDSAAAMDSISRVSAAHSAAISSSGDGEGLEAESSVVIHKRPNTNSEWRFHAAHVACYPKVKPPVYPRHALFAKTVDLVFFST